MIKPVEVLDVGMHGDQVGRLVMAPDYRAVFEYDPGWLARGFSISPFYLPLQKGAFTAKRDPFDGLFGVFNDSLPDGWGNLLLDRLLRKNGINPSSLSPVDRLSIIGSSGMGALTYYPENNIANQNGINDLDTLAAQVNEVLNNENTESLENLFQQGGSSGGARPKVLIQIDGDYWLVKFRSSSDPPNIGELEYNYSLLARRCGIEMPETRLFEGKYFGVKRFDRIDNKQLHLHSASGLLYASHRFPSLDYVDLLKATMALTRNIEELTKVFRLMIFNVKIENMDDHAKNFSYLYKDNKWQFAPAYDLLKSDGFNGQHITAIAGKGNPKFDDIMTVAKQVGISNKTALKIYEEVMDQK